MPDDIDFPRRNCADLWTEAEQAIKSAMRRVEEAGAHPLLTDAVCLLEQAFNKVADYVDLPDAPAPTEECAPRAQIIDLMEALKASLASR